MANFIKEDTFDIDTYRKRKIRICKELDQWKYLTIDEQVKFTKSINIDEIERLMTTSRKRAFGI